MGNENPRTPVAAGVITIGALVVLIVMKKTIGNVRVSVAS